MTEDKIFLNFRNISAPVRGVPATNNNAEIQAATQAIRQAEKMGKFIYFVANLFEIRNEAVWVLSIIGDNVFIQVIRM